MKNKKIVLITEDDQSLRKALNEKLNHEGFTVFQARDGQEGLDISIKEHPDLILIDILMPKMDGLTMLKELRKDEWGKKAHFIILTNVNDIEHLFLAMKMAEINDHESFEYFIKSEIKLEQVVEKIKKKLSE